MNAEILSIGTEILLGEIVDTNAAYLASELAQLGVNVYWVTQVGDNPERIREALSRSLSRSDIVVSSGGLGPTDDDQTREAIAAVLGEEPYVDPQLEHELRKRFDRMGRSMPAKNIKQAWLIPAAESLPNPLGTAPGWWVKAPNDRRIACMPGVPPEMRSMWTDQVRPRIEVLSRAAFSSETLKTFGSGESAVEEQLGELVKGSNPTVATYAKQDGVYVRIAARAESRSQAEELLRPVVEDAKARLGQSVFSSNNDSLASVVGEMLRKSNATVATAESLTGGLVCSYLTDVPGSSDHVLGGMVLYNEDIKQKFGVPGDVLDAEGVVSAETAEALAQAARERFGSDFGIGTTGAAGPEPHGGAAPGTAYIAVAGPDGATSRLVKRIGPRDLVKHHVALSAIDLLRRVLEDRST